jgi:hypothetical protein
VASRLVVKLPRDRVDEPRPIGAGDRFDPGHGRLMRERVSLCGGDRPDHLPDADGRSAGIRGRSGRVGPGVGDTVGMAVDVLSEIVIDRPCEPFAAYAADPSHGPDWYVNIASIEWLTEPPARVGSRMAFVARSLGRRLAYTYEIVEYEPTERLVKRTAQGPFPMETTYTRRAGPCAQLTLRDGRPLRAAGTRLLPIEVASRFLTRGSLTILLVWRGDEPLRLSRMARELGKRGSFSARLVHHLYKQVRRPVPSIR